MQRLINTIDKQVHHQLQIRRLPPSHTLISATSQQFQETAGLPLSEFDSVNEPNFENVTTLSLSEHMNESEHRLGTLEIDGFEMFQDLNQ